MPALPTVHSASRPIPRRVAQIRIEAASQSDDSLPGLRPRHQPRRLVLFRVRPVSWKPATDCVVRVGLGGGVRGGVRVYRLSDFRHV